MPGLSFGEDFDIGNMDFSQGYNLSEMEYGEGFNIIDNEVITITVEQTEDGVLITATDPKGTSSAVVHDGHTPVKGVDYFTEEDIEEMVSEVESRITTYTHIQAQASDTWTIEHNLHKMPSVTVVDSAGHVVVGELQYISQDKLIVSFSGIFSGKAYLN